MSRGGAPEHGTPVARLSAGERAFERGRRTLGLPLGPLAFLLMWLAGPESLDAGQSALAGVMLWVAIWWVMEPVPLPVTALLGPALCVLCGVAPVREMFAPFGSPIILLFLGSFLLAAGMSRHGLDRRVAYALLSLNAVRERPGRILVALGVLTAALSMWLSNTASTLMLYPIILGVVGAMQREAETAQRLGAALLLTCAYAASIGGVGTPVGTPPNLIALGQLDTLAGLQVSFASWMLVALPILAVMLAGHILIMRLSLPAELLGATGAGGPGLAERRRALGPMSVGERNVLLVFVLTVLGWVLPGMLALSDPEGPLASLPQRLPEAVVALIAATLLFVLPVDWRARRFTLEWTDSARVDWGTLLLFGGGLALGKAVFDSGLSVLVGEWLVETTGADSVWTLTLLFTITAIFLTELASNIASTTMLAPLALAAAQAAGVSVLEPVIGVALGASMSFMLPVSTAPNAIIYGSGWLRVTQMIRHGLILDLLACAVIPVGVTVLVPRVL